MTEREGGREKVIVSERGGERDLNVMQQKAVWYRDASKRTHVHMLMRERRKGEATRGFLQSLRFGLRTYAF